MKPDLKNPKTSDFLLPELTAIGDAVCQMLLLGVEEELLGEAILTKVQALIDRKQVTSADVVRLALVCDGLRVAEEAILADGTVSEVEVGYALPLVREAARRLGTFRAYYASPDEIASDGVREFMHAHRADGQLFGGACTDTRWLGLEIVTRLAQETRDRDALDKYAELMVRLSEEIVALEQGRVSADTIRTQLEERLGLRRLLEKAQANAPEPREDPRIRAFCSPDSPDVFHAVEHANQVWMKDPFDIDTVLSAPRAVFSRLVHSAAEQKDAGTGRVLLLLGDSGSGKTHLMRAFRNQAHGQRSGYVGYLQVSASVTDFGRYVLGSLIDSLEKPYDAPEVHESGLMCLSDALLFSARSITLETRRKLQEVELTDLDLCNLVYELADAVVSEPGFSGLDLDLIRALLFLQRREPRYHGRVIKFLRGQALNRYDSALLGELAPKGEDAIGLIADLGKLIACVDGGALVLLLDQLEDIYSHAQAKEQFVRVMDVLCRISDKVPNAVIVVSCLSDLYKELRQHVVRSVLDRVERDPEPQRLLETRSLHEVEQLIARRLSHLYASQNVRHRADEPHFPIPRALVESQAELRQRDVLLHLQAYRRLCLDAGRLAQSPVDPTVGVAPVPPEPVPGAAELTQAWAEEIARGSELVVPTEDSELLEVLTWSLQQAAAELPLGVHMPVERKGDIVQVLTPDRGDGKHPLHLQLVNDTSRGGKLAKQLDKVMKDAKKEQRTAVVIRCSDYGGTPGTKLASQLGTLAREGGRRCVFEQSSWQRLIAFRGFSAKQAADPRWKEWLGNERPLLQLDALRSVLGFPKLDTATRDTFVGGNAASVPVLTPKPVQRHNDVPVLPPVSFKAGMNDNGPLRVGVTMSVKQQPATIELEKLKMHSAFLGASGSGKTSLALNVIEQAVRRGIGAILVDRKGDLASYADPTSWTRKETDPERVSRTQALRAKTHVRLFTPGNPTGCSLRIRAVPAGLADLPPHERAQLARFAAQGLGTMMGYKGSGLELTYVAILGKAIEVIGQLTKDPTLRDVINLLADQDESLLAELGHLDPKHFKRLVDHLEVLRLNHGLLIESGDPRLSAESLLGLDGSIPDGKTPLTIISTKFLGGPQRVDFWVSQLLVELSRWCSRSPSGTLQSLIFLDEADAYMPATSKPATKEPLQDLLKRSRSAGLGVMLATQSPGDLDYKARDNIGTWWVGRIGSTTAIEKMKPLLSECRTDVSGSLATSSVGEFFQISDGNVARMRSERSLMDTVQLTEERILELARPEALRAKVVA